MTQRANSSVTVDEDNFNLTPFKAGKMTHPLPDTVSYIPIDAAIKFVLKPATAVPGVTGDTLSWKATFLVVGWAVKEGWVDGVTPRPAVDGV